MRRRKRRRALRRFAAPVLLLALGFAAVRPDLSRADAALAELLLRDRPETAAESARMPAPRITMSKLLSDTAASLSQFRLNSASSRPGFCLSV